MFGPQIWGEKESVMAKYVLLTLVVFLIGACDSSPKQSAVEMARQKEAAWKQIEAKGREVGLHKGIIYDNSKYLVFVERVKKSPRLKEAIRFARINDVDVFVSDVFKVYEGFVHIDASATDEQILEFLLGYDVSHYEGIWGDHRHLRQ